MDDAFIEAQEPRRSVKSIKLPINEDGSIDWDSATEKHKEAFVQAIKVDPNGILQNIQEEAGAQPSAHDDTGIADATVLAAVNAVMVVEGLGIATIGPRFAPPLKNLHPIVAIKACTVSLEELQPVMPECKRIIARYVPDEYLLPEYQDIFIVGKHLLQLSAEKFKDCVKLAMEIERVKASGGTASGPNGKVVEAETKIH